MNTPETMSEKPVTRQSEIPKEIDVRAEDIEISPDVERATGMKPTPSQFTTQVQDDQGQQMVHSPANQQVTITLPVSQAQLQHWSNGKITEAITWFALYWLRIIKKAAQNGWKVVSVGQQQTQNDD